MPPLISVNPPAASTSAEFLDVLQAVATAVSGTEGVDAKLETINDRSGVMELRVLAPNVDALLVPGSERVRDQIVAAGYDRVFEQAGFDFEVDISDGIHEKPTSCYVGRTIAQSV